MNAPYPSFVCWLRQTAHTDEGRGDHTPATRLCSACEVSRVVWPVVGPEGTLPWRDQFVERIVGGVQATQLGDQVWNRRRADIADLDDVEIRMLFRCCWATWRLSLSESG